ncbi:MAG: hypothetical protein FGM15_06465 [Chthoniobacterales bacterium]|nr:hypothetical protein [Chthoniobacterales bacterium]
MKKFLPILAALISTAITSPADDDYPVSVDELPQKVTAAVADYLPGSTIESARADEDDGRLYYDLKVLHQDELLHIEVLRGGRIREIDMNRGYPGLVRLIDRETSLSDDIAVDELPANVSAGVADFFPDSKIISAARGENDGKRFYRLRVRHRDLVLNMDVTTKGQILDIDTAK